MDDLDTNLINIVNRHHDEVVRAEQRSATHSSIKRQVELRNEPRYNNMRTNNINVRRSGANFMQKLIIGGVFVTLVGGSVLFLAQPKETTLPENVPGISSVATNPQEITTLGIDDCDFANVHIVLRAAKNETLGVVDVCRDEFDSLGVSCERINRDDDIVEVVQNARELHPGCEIVVMNIETGVERTDDYRTILMTDGINNRENTADTLVACMNTSFREYNLDPDVRSGKMDSTGRRTETSIERSLEEANQLAGVVQFTVDLPGAVGVDVTTRNDSASAIVEGAMRWAAIPTRDRHNDVYYMVQFGDTLSEIADNNNVSIDRIRALSDLEGISNLGAGWTVTLNNGPSTASSRTQVNNPTVTSNPSEISIITYSYIVSPGDTLSEIASDYGVPVSSIQTSSDDPNQIQAGETINIHKPSHILTSPKRDLTEGYGNTY